jgi:DNA-binding transcriptional LysR family regulator
VTIWHLNLRHLRAAAETERLGSLSAAAQAVSLTQPAVTQALARLETMLGLPLFDRHPGGMVATEAARVLAPRIRRALTLIASPRVTMAELRAMIALADAGAYVGASAATGLAPASLHRAIRDLSVALGRPLVGRRGRGLALTEAGRRVARAFRLAKAEIEAGLSELERLKGRETGRVAIGAMPLSRARLLPAAVTALYRESPDATIEIVEGSYAELLEPLRDGHIDLMIGAMRDPAAEGVAQVPLFADRPVVVGRAGHPLAGVRPSIVDLGAYPWTIARPGAPLRLLWQRMFETADMAPPRVPIECGSVMAIRQILLDSDFLTLLATDQVAVELEAGWLVRIREMPPDVIRTVGISTRIGWQPAPLQRRMIELLQVQSDKVVLR